MFFQPFQMVPLRSAAVEPTPERKNTLPEPLQADEPLLYPLIPTPRPPFRSAEDTEEEEEEEDEEDEGGEEAEGLDDEAAEMLRCSLLFSFITLEPRVE